MNSLGIVFNKIWKNRENRSDIIHKEKNDFEAKEEKLDENPLEILFLKHFKIIKSEGNKVIVYSDTFKNLIFSEIK